MSHFIVIVDTSKNDVDSLLAPYNEAIEVAPYPESCYCKRASQQKLVRTELEARFGGTFDDVKRKPYNELKPEDQPKWEEFIKDWVEFEAELEARIEGSIDPTCEDCKGTGTRHSTYNPDSKWDWYSTGGRWAGYFPVKKGVAIRLGRSGVFDNKPEVRTSDIVRVKDIDLPRAKTLDRKKAKEAYIRYTEEGHPFSDIEKGETLKAYVARKTADHPLLPFAFVDSEGVWHEKAEMGWFGMSANEKSDWNETFTKWFESLDPETELTAVDCHI